MSKKTYTPEQLEKYLILCAELVDEYGPIMQPWLDRLEMEYEKAKQRPTTPESAAERIRKKLGK